MEDKILGLQFKPVFAKQLPQVKFQKLWHFVQKVKEDSIGIRPLWKLQKRSFVFLKINVLKNSQYSQKITCTGASF